MLGRLTAEEVVGLFGPNEQGILRAALGEAAWESAWERYLSAYQERHDLCPVPFPGMKPLVERLHGCGCRLGLVTGKTATTATISLDVFGLSPFFSGIGGGAMKGIVKAERITALLKQWSVEPARAVTSPIRRATSVSAGQGHRGGGRLVGCRSPAQAAPDALVRHGRRPRRRTSPRCPDYRTPVAPPDDHVAACGETPSAVCDSPQSGLTFSPAGRARHRSILLHVSAVSM
jgi:hypothetical protein